MPSAEIAGYAVSATKVKSFPEKLAIGNTDEAKKLTRWVRDSCDDDPEFRKQWNTYCAATDKKRLEIYEADKTTLEGWEADQTDAENKIQNNKGMIEQYKLDKKELAKDLKKQMDAKDVAISLLVQDNKEQRRIVASKKECISQTRPRVENMKIVIDGSLSLFFAPRGPPELVQKYFECESKAKAVELVKGEINGQPAGPYFLHAIAATGVNLTDAHGPEGYDLNFNRIGAASQSTNARTVAEALCIGGSSEGLFTVDLERKHRRDESQERKRRLSEDPDSPFGKRAKLSHADDD